MLNREKIVFKGKTELDTYQVIDMVYEGRKARVLFSGDKVAAFSGMPLDGEHTLLFDYIQRFFELVSHVRPRTLLMVGGGTYTLPMALVHALPDIQIDIVEIDAGLDAIARDFFGFSDHERLRIVHADGKDFLRSSKALYDMVIVDAFINLKIPNSMASEEAARLMYKQLTPSGTVAINIISSYYGRNAVVIENFNNLYQSIFEHTAVYLADAGTSLWSSQNFILTAQKGSTIPFYGMRFGALDPPELQA